MSELRNGSLRTLEQMLLSQQGRKIDVVAKAVGITAECGAIRVEGTEPVLTPDGVDLADGVYEPTGVFNDGIAAKLGIPPSYLTRMRNERTDLWDANINGWLQGGGGAPPDQRKFMLRLFADGDGGGVARAFLSDKFNAIDHLDVLTASLDGVKQAGVQVSIDSCDLTERRMYVRLHSEEVAAMAPRLLAGYRSPWGGGMVDPESVVWAGLVITNSEVGCGASTITPRMLVRVCTNGLTVAKDAMRAVHLGGRQEEGAIRWSDDTNRKSLALVTARTKDAVRTFLDVDYMTAVIEELSEHAGRPVDDAAGTVERVTRQLGFTPDQRAGVLDCFIASGQLTAGGVMQAVTAFAQTVEDADDAAAIEAAGVKALELT